MINKLNIKTKEEFSSWLNINCEKEAECWINIKRGRPTNEPYFWYIDAVEVALSYGWIDSVWKKIDGVMWSRFSPRKKGSPWTELNKERVRRLEKLGLMTDFGRKALPKDINKEFVIPKEVEKSLSKEGVLDTFLSFPKLYQRVRAYNVFFYYNKNKETYKKALSHLIKETKLNKMYGEWNDYGRLLDY